jgi:hypothetical protein
MSGMFCFLLVILFVYTSASGQAHEWRQKIAQIRLLEHTYDDVVRILGKPIDRSGERKFGAYFDLKVGRVFAVFESGNCVVTPYSNGKPIGWRVPRWTVTRIGFEPYKPISPKTLLVEFQNFRKFPVEDMPGLFSYENDELGIKYSLNDDGKIVDIAYYPATRFQHLHCEGGKEKGSNL